MRRRLERWPVLSLLALAGACVTAERPAPPETDVRVEAPEAAPALARRVWGLGPQPSSQGRTQDPLPDGEQASLQGPTAAERALLRARFGSTILVGPDGTVTKQYFLTGEAGQVFVNLLQVPGEQTLVQGDQDIGPLVVGGEGERQSILGQTLGEQEVELFYLRDFEVPEGVPIRGAKVKSGYAPPTGAPVPPTSGAPNNLLLVTAEADALAAFEAALNLFFANIPQIEIEVKVVEFSTSDTLAFGVVPVDSSTPTLAHTESGKLIEGIVSQFPLSSPLLGSASIANQGTITLGGIHDSIQLAARLQALEANGVADILSSPRLVVRNGGMASVATTTDFPYPKASISASGQNVTTDIQFRPVGITLNIRPVIAGTETVILQVFASISAVTSFADTDPVQTPIISNRDVVTSVHVSDGKTSVIGGLVSNSTFEQTTQVPILGDIPVLGWLFRSTATTQSKTTLEFHITPRILRGPRTFVGG